MKDMKTSCLLKDVAPGTRIRMAHADDILVVLEPGDGLDRSKIFKGWVPVASTESWVMVAEDGNEKAFPVEDESDA